MFDFVLDMALLQHNCGTDFAQPVAGAAAKFRQFVGKRGDCPAGSAKRGTQD
jgi:hypothetical protein